jgi:hypothetical protein
MKMNFEGENLMFSGKYDCVTANNTWGVNNFPSRIAQWLMGRFRLDAQTILTDGLIAEITHYLVQSKTVAVNGCFNDRYVNFLRRSLKNSLSDGLKKLILDEKKAMWAFEENARHKAEEKAQEEAEIAIIKQYGPIHLYGDAIHTFEHVLNASRKMEVKFHPACVCQMYFCECRRWSTHLLDEVEKCERALSACTTSLKLVEANVALENAIIELHTYKREHFMHRLMIEKAKSTLLEEESKLQDTDSLTSVWFRVVFG